MKTNKLSILFTRRLKSALLFLIAFQISSFAQNRFEGSVVAGLNYSELEGSSIVDFFGPNVGLIGTAKLTNRCQLSIELLYSQNGEYILSLIHISEPTRPY